MRRVVRATTDATLSAPQCTDPRMFRQLPQRVHRQKFAGVEALRRPCILLIWHVPGDDLTLRKKLGLFGYDRSTKFEDVSDGLANTIYLIQVPPVYQRPWVAGGGATVQGVPESRSIAPFVSVQSDGKHGAFVLMADGSVRFIKETIDSWPFDKFTGEPVGAVYTPGGWWENVPKPGVWQALSTRAGGETLSADGF